MSMKPMTNYPARLREGPRVVGAALLMMNAADYIEQLELALRAAEARMREKCALAAFKKSIPYGDDPYFLGYAKGREDAGNEISNLDLSKIAAPQAEVTRDPVIVSPAGAAPDAGMPDDILQLLDELYWYHKKISGKTDDGKAWSVLFTEEHAQLSSGVVELKAYATAQKERADRLQAELAEARAAVRDANKLSTHSSLANWQMEHAAAIAKSEEQK